MRVIHQSQLTEEFDGTLPYDNSEWIEIRVVSTAADAVSGMALRYTLSSLIAGLAPACTLNPALVMQFLYCISCRYK